jgi:hypothetical protein
MSENPAGPHFSEGGLSEEVLRVGGAVTTPVLIRDGRPTYTETLAKPARIIGPIVIEAIIDAQGRVSDARFLRGGDQPGAPGALGAIRQRLYQPATLDGKPVAVYVVTTVSINYQ